MSDGYRLKACRHDGTLFGLQSPSRLFRFFNVPIKAFLCALCASVVNIFDASFEQAISSLPANLRKRTQTESLLSFTAINIDIIYRCFLDYHLGRFKTKWP